MSNFLEGYEDVNARITRARAEYPGLRLVAYIAVSYTHLTLPTKRIV